jgi:hypothetical protein
LSVGSTPLGIAEFLTLDAAPDGKRCGAWLCSTPFGVTDFVERRSIDQRGGCGVALLNAFRQH